MSKEATQTASADAVAWFDGKAINEALFCEEFLRDYPMISVGGTFFTVNGLVNDEIRLEKEIYTRIKPYVTTNLSKRVKSLLDVMRIECCTDDLLLYQDRIHVANGTYHLDGTFSTEKDYCRNRLPVAYNPEAPQPVTWLHFLSQLLEPEDILTVQEFIGYTLKAHAINSMVLRAENTKLKEQLKTTQKSAAYWKKQFDDLKEKAQPYLDALEIAAERVRAFLFTILARGKETQEHKQPARRKQQDMEL